MRESATDATTNNAATNDATTNIATDGILKTNLLYNFKKECHFNAIETQIEPSDIRDYVFDGIFYNLYGGDLIDDKWMLYMYVLGRHIQTNDLNSLHLGADSGSVQSAFHHLLNFSTVSNNREFQWNWISLDDTNEYRHKYPANFIHLGNANMMDQINLIISGISKKNIEINLVVFQQPKADARNSYLLCLIIILKCLDSSGSAFIEFAELGNLQLHVLAACSLIFHSVTVSRYDLGTERIVAVCKKKKSIASGVVKKLIKIMTESNTDCITNGLDNEWVAGLIKVAHVRFEDLAAHLNSILEQNLDPL